MLQQQHSLQDLFALEDPYRLVLGFLPSEHCTGITDDWGAALQYHSTKPSDM